MMSGIGVSVSTHLGLPSLLFQSLNNIGCSHLNLAEIFFGSSPIQRDCTLGKTNLLLGRGVRLCMKRAMQAVHDWEVILQVPDELCS